MWSQLPLKLAKFMQIQFRHSNKRRTSLTDSLTDYRLYNDHHVFGLEIYNRKQHISKEHKSVASCKALQFKLKTL